MSRPQSGNRPSLVVRSESRLAVGADVLEKEVAEGDRLDIGQGWGGERLRHACFVDVVDARRRDANLHERNADRVGLPREQLAANAVHADPVVGVGDGRDQRLGLDPFPA